MVDDKLNLLKNTRFYLVLPIILGKKRYISPGSFSTSYWPSTNPSQTYVFPPLQKLGQRNKSMGKSRLLALKSLEPRIGGSPGPHNGEK